MSTRPTRPCPVITGVGVVSPFGVGFATFADKLARGESAVRPIRSFDASTFPVRVAAEVPALRLDADWLLESGGGWAKQSRVGTALDDAAPAWEADGRLRDRRVGLAVVAALEAWADAGCGDDERTAPFSFALGLERALLDDLYAILDRERAGPGEERDRAGGLGWADAEARGLPVHGLRTPVDLPARSVSAVLGLRGPRYVHASACAAGAYAVAHAASLVRRGSADVVLTGGADSMINALGVAGMARLGAPSPRNTADACRPFHRARDGLVIGEGAAAFVVESEDRARARGARVYARVLGSGRTQDGHKATAPLDDGRRAAEAMRRAIASAGLTAEAIGYVNAHGTGTPLNDVAETAAILIALGEHGRRVPTSSVKGAVGHWMAASGAGEIAATLLAFERDTLCATAHLDDPDPACPLDHVAITPRRAEVEAAISNSFGFGGQNGSVVLGRPR